MIFTADFCELFCILPSFILKGFQQLITEETKGYHTDNFFNVTDFCLHDIQTNGRMLQASDVDSLFNHPRLVKVFQQWDMNTKEIFDGIVKARENLGTKNYSKKEIEDFIKKNHLFN